MVCGYDACTGRPSGRAFRRASKWLDAADWPGWGADRARLVCRRPHPGAAWHNANSRFPRRHGIGNRLQSCGKCATIRSALRTIAIRIFTLETATLSKTTLERPWLKHYDFWVPAQLTYPHRPVDFLLDLATIQYPDNAAPIFYGQ